MSQENRRLTNCLMWIMYPLTHSPQNESQLYTCEDNEAFIKMVIKGRSPTARHVSRTQRVALDWLFDRINLEPRDPNQMC